MLLATAADNLVHFGAIDDASKCVAGAQFFCLMCLTCFSCRNALWLFKEKAISASEAEIVLRANGAVGSFFVYQTASDRSRSFALLFRMGEEDIRHFRIVEDNGEFRLNNRKELFPSVLDLIAHFRQTPLVEDRCLGEPIEFRILKEYLSKQSIPETVPDESLDDYIDQTGQIAALDVIIDAATRLEEAYSADETKQAFLGVLRQTLSSARASKELLSSLVQLTASGASLQEMDGKSKFQNQQFFKSALMALEAELIKQQQEMRALEAEVDLLEPILPTEQGTFLALSFGASWRRLTFFLSCRNRGCGGNDADGGRRAARDSAWPDSLWPLDQGLYQGVLGVARQG